MTLRRSFAVVPAAILLITGVLFYVWPQGPPTWASAPAAQTKTISSREIAAPAMKVITVPGPALITAA